MAARMSLLCLLFAGCLLFATVRAQGEAGEEAATDAPVEETTAASTDGSSTDAASTDASSTDASTGGSTAAAASSSTTQPPPEGCPRFTYGSCQEKCETDADCLKNGLKNRKCCPCNRISIPFLIPAQNVTNSCVAVPPQ